MTHDQVQERLDTYVDGDLPPAEHTEVEVHVKRCVECQNLLARLGRLMEDAEKLPASIEPPIDLWPSIARGLDQRSTGRWWFNVPRSVWAAAAAVTIVGSAAYLWMQRNPVLVPVVDGLVLPVRYQDAESHYIAAFLELDEILEVGRERLSPETVDIIDRNLRIIDAAIAESRAALASDPANQDLWSLLSGRYRDRIDLLQSVSRLTARS